METQEEEVHCRKLLHPVNALAARQLSLIVQQESAQQQKIIVKIRELSALGRGKIKMNHLIPSSWWKSLPLT
jgi:hypothetical protein